MAVLGSDDHAAIQADFWAVLTSSTLRFKGRNFADMAVQSVDTGFANQAALTSLAGALTADEATLVGLVQGADSDTKAGIVQFMAALTAAPAGAVDVKTLAAALAPLLPAGASPATIGEAVVAAFEAHLAATPPTGGTA